MTEATTPNGPNDPNDTLVLATRNRHKAAELAALIEDLGWTVRTLTDWPDAPTVIEDGETCRANAMKKADEIARFTGCLTLADDTGLEVDALGGRPGVHAARYAGDDATYEDNCRKLLRELEGVPPSKRTARFITVIAIAEPDAQGRASIEMTEGVLEGLIAEREAGRYGFGYDPVFWIPELKKTLAELSPEEKNRISHRARALANARELLEKRRFAQSESGRSAAR